MASGLPHNVVHAPASSHIGRFAINEDELYVTFKDKNGGETVPYIYQFPTPEEAAKVYEEMERSDHPYGGVFCPDVRDAGIPFYN